MVSVFSYIKEHLDGNGQAIYELGEEFRTYGGHILQIKAEMRYQLYLKHWVNHW